ncbi:MAG: glycosyltransferase involved in cell wall biosynthesis [Planctomycetota bacterium]|jgi:glycosyltransferase involved in cell wall biosynthesis
MGSRTPATTYSRWPEEILLQEFALSQKGLGNLVHSEGLFDPAYPIVTVVIASFNSVRTLDRTLQSIINQEYENIELIVVDGGSTDGTIKILEEFDRHIKFWISEDDAGVYDAMNKGIKHGTGDWYYFLGADDTLLDGFSRIVRKLCDTHTIYYGDVWMPKRGIRYDGEFSPFRLSIRNICHQSIFYPSCIWNHRCFESKYAIMADYALNLVCFGDPDLKMKYVPETVAIFNDAVGLSQTTSDNAFEIEKLNIVRANFPLRTYWAAVVWHRCLEMLRRTGVYQQLWKVRMFCKRTFQ